MTLKILLADDHQLLREGLRSLLEKQHGFQIVAEAENGRKAVELAKETNPALIIMDLNMPDLNGIEATRRILKESPRIKIIALSMHSDKRYVTRALQAGATGYVLKDNAFDELTKAIQRVMQHRIYLSPEINQVVVKEYLEKSKQLDQPAYSVLTEREREVVQLIAEGKSTKEIAAILKISVKTVETYRQRTMDKLNINNIADLIKFAIREGLSSLDS
ncbi:MAG TPA: response regulator transcription factor [Acidobacteriota bacterium]|jgi:RNA polymerase sigma factor (sigma-70 family)